MTDYVREKSQEDALKFYHTLRDCKDNFISSHLNSALDALRDTLRLYGPDCVFSSYNGGKDADVIMHLLRAVCAKYQEDNKTICVPKLVYFGIENEFDEVLDHLHQTERLYNVNLLRYDCGIIEGIKKLITSSNEYAHSAFILGTRKGDPNSRNQEVFAPSSTWMPVPFMRVNPILNWDYGHVWHFLRTYNLPYCSLYDRGYTSLGSKTNTFPNPALQRKCSNLTITDNAPNRTEDIPYWPAYMLSDWKLERSGRMDKKVTSTKTINDDNNNHSNQMKVPTAGLVIIGDEILNGFTSESNLLVTSKALVANGITLKKVSVIPDEIDVIKEEVLAMSQKYDMVFTSGGIGPTHDDVTIKAVAEAFQQEIALNPMMMKHLEYIQQENSPSNMSLESSKESIGLPESMTRLALLPKNATLHFPPPPDDYYSKQNSLIRQKTWPILQCENVFILPGVPQYYADKIALIMKYFLPIVNGQSWCKESRKIILDIEEREFLIQLDTLVQQHPNVKIGSYPYVDHPEFKTIITVEGYSQEKVENAVRDLIDRLPKHVVLRVEQDTTKKIV